MACSQSRVLQAMFCPADNHWPEIFVCFKVNTHYCHFISLCFMQLCDLSHSWLSLFYQIYSKIAIHHPKDGQGNVFTLFICSKGWTVHSGNSQCSISVLSKEVIHIISFEPISERATSNYFHEPSVKSVRVDVIGIFWRATTRELYRITWIDTVGLHTVPPPLADYHTAQWPPFKANIVNMVCLWKRWYY